MKQTYYIEQFEGGKYNFNLWEKNGERYYNIATLFYQDPMCGTEWTVEDKTKAINYSISEIQDEIETPLREITLEKAQELINLKTAQEVATSIENILN